MTNKYDWNVTNKIKTFEKTINLNDNKMILNRGKIMTLYNAETGEFEP